MKNRMEHIAVLAATIMLVASLLFDSTAWAVLRVAVISDLNGSYGSTRYEPAVARAINRLVAMKPELVIITGDMIAGQRLKPPLRRGALDAMWHAFHTEVTDPIRAAGIPIAVTPGNHDASVYANFARERKIYREQWLDRIPSVRFVDRKEYPFNYAFAVGEVLFISLDATRAEPLENLQHSWIEGLLTRVGGKFQHRVVFSHLPIYPFAEDYEKEVTNDRELERLLQRHGVELYLSGHHHAFYAAFRNGIRFIGQACLGAAPRRLIGSRQVSERAATWLEFKGNQVSVTALIGSLFDRPVDLDMLPRSIRSRFGILIRDDLRPADLRGKPTTALAAGQP